MVDPDDETLTHAKAHAKGKPTAKAAAADEPPADDVLAQTVERILNEKDDAGEYKYSNDDVMNFVAACVIELGLDTPPALTRFMERFFEQFDIMDEATDEEIAEALAEHFRLNPLNPELLAAFETAGRARKERFAGDFEDDEETEATNTAARAVGRMRAARAPSEDQVKRRAPVLKRGLS